MRSSTNRIRSGGAAPAGATSQATSRDVARLAGVSQSAVSRTFTPGASVAEDTRRKVLEAARRLGYRPNAHARSLITGRSRIVGLVVSYIGNLFYPVVLERMAKRLQEAGYHLLLFVSDGSDADELVDTLLEYKVDGIVLTEVTLSSTLAQRCTQASIPVVLFNRVMGGDATVSVTSVRSDNTAGAREVASFLVAGGHERIAFIAGQEDASTNLERERGFRQGLAQAGRHLHSRAVGGYDFAQARLAVRELFTGQAARPDAVFVASDHMAIAAIDALRHDLGLRVPEDVSVVGFDDVPQSAWSAYRLTTVAQPLDAMLAATTELIERSFGNDSPSAGREIVLAGRLIVRASARIPPDWNAQ